MSLVNALAWAVFNCWSIPSLWILPFRPTDKVLLKWQRIMCIPGVIALVVGLATGDHSWLLYLTGPLCGLSWLVTHRRYCKDGHGRKLKDAAAGLVRRTGNRLTVVPAGSR